MVKKIISGALSAAILFTTAATSGFLKTPGAGKTQTTRTTNESSNGDYQLEASNSLGNYISDAMQNKEKPQKMAYRCVSEYDYDIGYAEFDRNTGVLTVHSSQPADIKLDIVFNDDISKAEVCRAEMQLKEGKDTVTSTNIDTSALPEFFTVDLQMLDSMKRDMCDTYTITTYTQFTQEIKATDISDFDEEYVVNLDEDESTNFFVLSNDTIIGVSSEDTNILVSADYENDQYVFDKIDDTIRYLNKGDHFYIRPTEMDIIALSVGDITIDGDRATLTGDENTEGIFDFIKIETMADDISDFDVNNENLPDSIENNGTVVDENGENAIEYTIDSSYSYLGFSDGKGKIEKEYSFGDFDDADYDALLDGPKPASSKKDNPDFSTTSTSAQWKSDKVKVTAGLSGKLTFSAEFEYNFYQKWTHVELELKFSPQITVEVEFGGKIEIPISLPELQYPVLPGLIIGFEPEITFTFEGKIKYKKTIGFDYIWSFDTSREGSMLDKFKDSCEPIADSESELQIEASAKVSLDIKPYFCIISKHILQIEVEMPLELGIECNSTKLNEDNSQRSEKYPQVLSFPDSPLMDSDKFHSCEKCCDVQPFFSTNITLKLRIPCVPILKTLSLTLFETNYEFLKMYYSSTHNVADFGDCPYQAYKTTFKIKGTDELSSAGAEVVVDGLSATADSKGVVNFYCENGSHDYYVLINDEKVASDTFSTDSAVQTINISLESNSSEVSSGSKIVTTAPTTKAPLESHIEEIPEFPKEHRYIESGRLGDYIFYYIYPNGEMNISGHGDMYNSVSAIENIKTVTTVNIQDDAPDEGSYITSISNGLFNGATNLEIVYLSDNIQKIGDFAFNDCSKLKYFRYGGEDDQSKTLRLPKDLTHIGYCAFNNCKSAAFDELIMPDNISYIGGQAFSNCNGLTSLKINGNDAAIDDAAFYKCHNLKEAYFGSGVKTFEDNILSDCYSVEKLTLPRVDETFHRNIGELFYVKESSDPDKTYITSYYGTPKSLTSITVLGGKSIDSNTFSGMTYLKEIDLPEGITNIGIYAFADCTNVELDPKKLLKDVEIIGERAFQNCTSIDFGKIVFSDNIKTIGMCAFDKCSGITSLMVYGKETSIDKYAFSSCSNLKEAEFGSGVISIGEYVLSDCLSVEKLTVPRLEDISSNGIAQMFYVDEPSDPKKVYDGAGFAGTPKSLTSVTVLSGKSINANAFQGMSSLNEINIPEGITQIGNRAFENCTNVKLDINKLLKNVESIGEYAFSNCSATEFGDIVLPEKLKKIESGTFYNCTGITGVYFYKNMESVGSSAFHGCNSIEKVQYEGTDEEWDEFEKSIETDNDPILRKDILTCNADAPAVKNTPFAKGDTNGDGVIELTDAILIMQAIANPDKYGVGGTAKYHMTLEGLEAADIENDGVTVGDALMIQEYLLGLRPTLNLA